MLRFPIMQGAAFPYLREGCPVSSDAESEDIRVRFKRVRESLRLKQTDFAGVLNRAAKELYGDEAPRYT